MRFRKNLFTILALLTLVWMIYALATSGRVAGDQLDTQQAQESTAFQAGTVIGAGIASSVVLCTGIPFFFLFAILAWRNGVGLTNKRRHEETIAAIQQQKQ